MLTQIQPPLLALLQLEQLLAAPPAWSEGEGVAALRAASSFFHVDLGKPQDVTSPAESTRVLAALSEPKREQSYQNLLYWWGMGRLQRRH